MKLKDALLEADSALFFGTLYDIHVAIPEYMVEGFDCACLCMEDDHEDSAELTYDEVLNHVRNGDLSFQVMQEIGIDL